MLGLGLLEGQKLHSLLVQAAPMSDCPHGEKCFLHIQYKLLLFQFTPFIVSSSHCLLLLLQRAWLTLLMTCRVLVSARCSLLLCELNVAPTSVCGMSLTCVGAVSQRLQNLMKSRVKNCYYGLTLEFRAIRK